MPAADSRAASTATCSSATASRRLPGGVGACDQVAALLARDPATHVVLYSPPSVAEEYLHE